MDQTTKDVSMVDVSDVKDEEPRATGRRKSTLILTDDMDRMNIEENNQNEQAQQQEQHQHQQQHQQQQQQNQQQAPPQPNLDLNVPVDIKWVQGGEKVYVTGSFTGWRKMIGLTRQADNSFLITLGLPVGTHRFRFVVDNELRFSDFLPTATDQMGNFVNYVEVTQEHVLQAHPEAAQPRNQESQKETTPEPPKSEFGRSKSSLGRQGRSDLMWGLINDDDDMGNGYSRYHDDVDSNDTGKRNYQYINDIPPIFTDPKVMEQYYEAIDKQAKTPNVQPQAWLHPPQLPPHLENVILNNFNSNDKDNNLGALPIPNHVVLNHLATTSIKHNTLAVASIVRYKRKYITQVLYAPLQQ